MNQKVIDWLGSGDTGLSSLTIVAHIERNPIVAAQIRNVYHWPCDPADLGRCIRLLDIEPTYRANLVLMVALGDEWKVLYQHWDELEALYREEEPSGRAPKCYKRMRELLDPIWEKKASERRAQLSVK